MSGDAWIIEGGHKLRPCPFCGGSELTFRTEGLAGTWHAVRCKGCHAVGPVEDTEAGVVESWNRRENALDAGTAKQTEAGR